MGGFTKPTLNIITIQGLPAFFVRRYRKKTDCLTVYDGYTYLYPAAIFANTPRTIGQYIQINQSNIYWQASPLFAGKAGR